MKPSGIGGGGGGCFGTNGCDCGGGVDGDNCPSWPVEKISRAFSLSPGATRTKMIKTFQRNFSITMKDHDIPFNQSPSTDQIEKYTFGIS